MPIVRDTIADSLAILRLNLDNALNSLQAVPADGALDAVVVSNIAFVESPTSGRTPSLANKVVLTLVKIEEEYSLKNRPAHRRNPVSGTLEYVNPPVFLNLYVLMTANMDDYGSALTYLSRMIGYFQHQRVFNETNATLPPGSPIQHFEFHLSLESPSLEQLNHLWSILGGKHLPGVLYKIQLQRIEYIPDEVRTGSPIQQIVVNEQIF